MRVLRVPFLQVVAATLAIATLAIATPLACQDKHKPAPAAQPAARVHLLWPDGAPGARGEDAHDQARLHVYLASPTIRAPAPRPAIVICPGGGYGALAMGHEGHAIARWLVSIGVSAAILQYRHRRHGYGHPIPLGDAQRALRYVRARAGAWKINPEKVGVLGFSAGGHLASSVSVHFDAGRANAKDPIERRSCRPDFAVLCYGVLAFGKPYTHKGSQRNLLGKAPPPELVREMSSEDQVHAGTPPTFLWHTSADRGVPPENSVHYYLALRRHKVPCELHIFERGRHGIGLAKGKAAEAWPELCRRWFVARGVLAR